MCLQKDEAKVSVGRSRVFLERKCKTKVSYNKKRKTYDDDSTSIAATAASTDRLSNLPEHILHHILSRLRTEEVIKTCILSKTLMSLWRSFPVLNFKIWTREYVKPLDEFLNHVKRIIQQRGPSKRAADVLQKFQLDLLPYRLLGRDARIDVLIHFAINNGVKELALSSLDYPLPDIAFGRSITSLSLFGLKVNKLNQLLPLCPLLENLKLIWCPRPEHFKIVGSKIKSFCLEGSGSLKSVEIACPSLELLTFMGQRSRCNHFSLFSSSCNFLKELVLMVAPITDNWTGNFLPGLVLLEKLELTSCNELKNVKVSNHNLKLVKFGCCRGLQVIEVRVKNLESFMYSGYTADCICNINIIYCKHLKQLKLYNIPEDFLQEQVSKLLELDRLNLELTSSQKRVEIFHENLKHLKLKRDSRVLNTEVKICTPSLVSFRYTGKCIPFVSFHYNAIVSATLDIYGVDILAPSFFEQWYELIRFMGGCKVLTFRCTCKDLIFPQEMRKVLTSPLVHLKHMRVEILLHEMTVVELVDSLLWLSPYLDTLVIVTANAKHMVLSIKFEYERPTDKEEDSDQPFSRQLYWSRKVDMEVFEEVEEERANLVKYFKGELKSARMIKRKVCEANWRC